VIRLLLCFFLQEKELVPKELFDEHFLKENLKENEEYRYYNGVLRNLIFHCLNISIKDRKNFEHTKLLKNISNAKEQFQKIPFLNGGLFNEHEDDNTPLGNIYFFEELHTENIQELDGDYKVEGIIRILSKYRYKLTLDDLFDHAEYTKTIDPEFLGKVFESLLSCIDADTKENRRKVTGSYYTPREIVDYMVNESLDLYLQNDSEKDLLQCKILDPACGSGAFPCGIMNEIMRRLDPEQSLSQSERYQKKLEILQNVIYGVDIQPIAVQIAVLRLFLALIQEIKPDKKQNNYGIEPLPNLETKFVCANTLIGLRNGGQQYLQSPQVKAAIKMLALTRRQHLSASTIQEKERLQKYDDEQRKLLIQLMETDGELSDANSHLLLDWNPYNQMKSSPFFDSIWMFGVEKFDIIIGNPPYVEAKKLKKIVVHFKKEYEIYSGTADLSVYFIERGLKLCKNSGLLMFITTNKFFNTGYGKLVREYLLKYQIHSIIDFEQVEVFESTLVSSVVIGVKNKPIETDEFCYQRFYQLKADEFRTQFTDKRLVLGRYKQSLLGKDEWSFSDKKQLILKKKIEKAGQKLSDIEGVAIYRGVTTGYNPAFIIDNNKQKELINDDKNNKTIIKPLLQGRNIRKWIYNENNDFLIFIPWHFPLHLDNTISGNSKLAQKNLRKNYPSIYNHLLRYKANLSNRNKEETNIRYEWYALQRCAASYYPEFEKEKIIWGLTADKWAFAYDDKKHYLPSNGYILTSENISIKYLLGLLNSELLKYYFGFIGVMTAGGAYTLKYATIQKLPIVAANNPMPIISRVDKILLTKHDNLQANVSQLEAEINAIVFHLYGLTETEMLTVLRSLNTNETEIQQIQSFYKKSKEIILK
jgi:methylase of polypeptide subunit release factors